MAKIWLRLEKSHDLKKKLISSDLLTKEVCLTFLWEVLVKTLKSFWDGGSLILDVACCELDRLIK